MRNAISWGLIAAGAAAMLAFARPAQATASLCDAIAGNLVTNCGFEAMLGSGPTAFPGWTVTPAVSRSDFGVDNFAAHSGNNGAFFQAATPFDTISQTLATSPGKLYDFSFFLANVGQPSVDEFKAALDGAVLFDMVNASLFVYTEETFAFLGTGSNTISLAAYNGSGAFFLDDVSVAPAAVPEPASLALLGSALAAFGVVPRRRRAV